MSSLLNKNKIIKGSMAVGMTIWINQSDEFEINAIVISDKRGELNILNKYSFTKSEELQLLISKNVPVYLSIDGKGILHKILDAQYNGPLLDALLPNAEKKDFVIQNIALDKKRKLISIIRKEKLEEIILMINNYGLNILKLCLGPFSISGLLQFSEGNSIISVPYFQVFLKDNSIDGFEKNNNSTPDFGIELKSEKLQSPFIVPFSNSLQHFVESSTNTIEYPMIKNHVENFTFKRLFLITGFGFMLFLFLCLLLNFLVFEHIRQKNQLLVSNIGANKEIFNRIENFKKLIIAREEFLKDNRIPIRSLFAYYSDRLAKDVPAGITLNRLNVFPLQKQLTSKETTFSFQYGKILVSGSTFNSSYLNSWISALRKLTWIKQVSIKNYSDNGAEPARFDLEISLNESSL